MREALRELQPPVAIEAAGDCDEALMRLQQRAAKPSLILLDFNLPKSDPRDFLRQMKGDERLRSIPIAVLTTSDAEKDIREAYSLHANCYLRKPLDLDGFFSTIRAAAHFWLEVARTPTEGEGDAAKNAHLL
jgi:two-component system, chemotaxis family, response regulator Rcp1